jgi:autotransporter-associated beta strand protein
LPAGYTIPSFTTVSFDGGTLATGNITNLSLRIGFSSGPISILATTSDVTLGGAGTGHSGTNVGGLTVVGGQVILSTSGLYSGVTTISSDGQLQVGNGSSVFPSSWLGVSGVVDNGFITFSTPTGSNYTFSESISGSGALQSQAFGTGKVTLSAANTYTGATSIVAGTLQLGNSAALQNSTLNYWSFGGTLSFGSLTAATLGGLAGDKPLALANNAAVPLALTVGNNGSSSTYSGALSGPGSLVKTGAGTLALSGANTYTGGTTITAGTLQIGSGGTTGSLTGNIANTAAIVFNRSDASTYSSAISGNGTLTKQGAGTLTLSGLNTYSGVTTVSAGTLNLTGSAASSAFTLNGGTLSGSGTVGALTVGSGGRLSPGNSTGTLSAGSTTWNGGGAFTWELNQTAGAAGATQGWDLLSVTGALAIGANSANKFTINLTSLTSNNTAGTVIDFNSASNYSFTIATTTGGITGFSSSAFTLDTANFQNGLNGTWAINQVGNNLTLDYTAAIPEPSTYAALFGAGVFACAAWRRRKQNR